ncbi:endonuclease/exonuclease/phosphatase family protein [Phaeodactylibacter sp.]|uniref:endonuclease/exonuclease/phosphatase family protein n=1 Tax=Phaeodactylibacter sp. TaxID=1940289 RepID=UPI0025E47961|nr:endonuclease/exonuclease/phosphatase family protein [Phaeodactylibacter sp.]MCI5091170.1 endonuclease/exonuclease/phosphatase family protein [Phaeodactylibacter sp.]
MKIISWNCQMAFRKKFEPILASDPDIVVIQECEHPDKLKFGKLMPSPNNYIWYGDNLNKGIGVFSFNQDIKLEKLTRHDPSYKYVIPVKVTGCFNFNLFAIWAMGNKSNWSQRYIGQVWSSLNYYHEELKEKSIIIGDFNWNKIWDNATNLSGNLTQTYNYLKKKGYISIYHHQNDEPLGKESTPTFYLQRNKAKPYHIDYSFYKTGLFTRVKKFRIGDYPKWIKLSDHMPIEIIFE